MPMLHPTLWRTCRVLAGPTRLVLFRLIVDQPGQSVSELAERMDLSRPRASQELRRLQSRGLVRADRTGRFVFYHPAPDRLVSTAPPLLEAMQEAFRRFPPTADAQTIRIAVAGSHSRRLAMLRLLLVGPWKSSLLRDTLGMAPDAFHRHLALLQAGGLVLRQGRILEVTTPDHPLAIALFEILRDTPAAI